MNKELLAASILDSAAIDFVRSGGPGGQNVNKVNTKVIARVPLCKLAGLDAQEMELVRTRLSGRINAEDEIVVSVQEERSQVQNRERALLKLVTLVAAAARKMPPRIPTKPTRASKERKLATKSRRAAVKENRQKPQPE